MTISFELLCLRGWCPDGFQRLFDCVPQPETRKRFFQGRQRSHCRHWPLNDGVSVPELASESISERKGNRSDRAFGIQGDRDFPQDHRPGLRGLSPCAPDFASAEPACRSVSVFDPAPSGHLSRISLGNRSPRTTTGSAKPAPSVSSWEKVFTSSAAICAAWAAAAARPMATAVDPLYPPPASEVGLVTCQQAGKHVERGDLRCRARRSSRPFRALLRYWCPVRVPPETTVAATKPQFRTTRGCSTTFESAPKPRQSQRGIRQHLVVRARKLVPR